MPRRQEVEGSLSAVTEALAPESARSDRDFGLNDVIAGAQWVLIGIEKREQPFLLVGPQYMGNVWAERIFRDQIQIGVVKGDLLIEEHPP